MMPYFRNATGQTVFVLACFLLLTLAPRTLTAQPNACTLEPRLIVGQRARVITDTPVNIRSQPTTTLARLGYVTPGANFSVLEGPVCADGFQWWQVEFAAVDVVPDAGTSDGDTFNGWIAEGSPSSGEYWLEHRGTLVLIENEDGEEIAFIEDAEGNLEREGCLKPPEDYTRVNVNGALLNARTVAMLDNAQRIYRAGGGSVNFRLAVTQGSYNPGGVSASFGTHDGGGAVDISVRSPLDNSILSGEIMPMLDALRVAGFAAWLRDTGELYENSPIHIHAIAIGDAEQSEAAQAQMNGEYGYLRGYNGLPEGYGGPALDIYGEPVICQWMIEMGFDDLRENVEAEATPEATVIPGR
jgi:hypothetical protein